jgi:hypothetical protein
VCLDLRVGCESVIPLMAMLGDGVLLPAGPHTCSGHASLAPTQEGDALPWAQAFDGVEPGRHAMVLRLHRLDEMPSFRPAAVSSMALLPVSNASVDLRPVSALRPRGALLAGSVLEYTSTT